MALLTQISGCAQYTAEPMALAFLLNQSGVVEPDTNTPTPTPSITPPGITITESGGSTSVTESSGYDFYTIVLNTQPSANVSISLAFDTSQIKINSQIVTPQVLTFTTSNWSAAQTIIIRAVDDALVEGNHTSSITHTVSSTDSDYNGMTLAAISVSITDNDGPGIRIIQSGGTTILTEGGGSDTYDIVLTKLPGDTVTVNIAFDSTQFSVNGSTISPVILTFTTANWFTPQTVTLLALNDGLVEGTHSKTITHTSSSVGDPGYTGLSIDSVSASITDINGPGVSIVESSGSTNVAEGSTVDSYSVVLTSSPSANVSVNINFDNTQLTVNGSSTSPQTLTFTSGNWNTPQNVSIAAVNDTVIEGTHSSLLSHSVTSSDSSYNGISTPGISVGITDDDITPIVAGGVQTGVVTTSAAITTTAITAVDTSKAFVMCYFTTSSSNMNNVPTCQLSSSTQITIQNGGGGGTINVRYYVMEFASGALVQRNGFNMASALTTQNITIPTPVDLSRSFVIAYARIGLADTAKDERRLVRAELTSTNNIKFTRGESGTAIDVEWQVIQLDGAQVQTGLATIPDAGNTVTAPLGVIDPNSAFLISSFSTGDGMNGDESDYLTTGNISSSSSLTFTRGTVGGGGNQEIYVSWFLVEMINGPKIQKGTITSSATSDTAVLSAVNTALTMPIISFNLSDADAASLDSGYYRPTITSSTLLTVDRYNTESKTCTVDWYTIELTSL